MQHSAGAIRRKNVQNNIVSIKILIYVFIKIIFEIHFRNH